MGRKWYTFTLNWPFLYDGDPSLVGFLYTCFRFTIRIMLQRPEVLDGNTLLIAQEGILYIAAWVISTIKNSRGMPQVFQFRESRHANLWYAFYMRVKYSPEYQNLPRRDEGELFLLCLYSVLASCPEGGHQIHVLSEPDYVQFNNMVDPNRFIEIPPELGPDEPPFEGIPSVEYLRAAPFHVPRVHTNRHGIVAPPDVSRRSRPVQRDDWTHDRNAVGYLEYLLHFQETIRSSLATNRVVTADVRYYRSILMNESAIQRLRREENMAVSEAVRENILFIQQHGYARGHRPRNHTSPPRELVVHRDPDPDDEDGEAGDRVGDRRPRRGLQEEPPGARARIDDPQPQENVVQGQQRRTAQFTRGRQTPGRRRNDPDPEEYIVQDDHRRTPLFDRNSVCFTPTRRTTRANVRVNNTLGSLQQRLAAAAIEARAQALRSRRDFMGPIIFQGPILYHDDGLVPDLNPIY